MPSACCYVPYTTLVTRSGVYPAVRASKPAVTQAAGSIWATDVPGWITAVGTAILAVFAILTTVFAIRAFRKQAKEVSDQAEMLHVQSEQLAEQRRINEKEIEVLELQAAELRESLEERKREAEQRRRAQASRIFIWTEYGPDPAATDDQATAEESARFGLIAHVRNTSGQPIYDLTIDWNPQKPPWVELDPITVLMPEDQAKRFCPYPNDFTGNEIWPTAPIAQFRDAAGAYWLLTTTGQLDKQPGPPPPPPPLQVTPSRLISQADQRQTDTPRG